MRERILGFLGRIGFQQRRKAIHGRFLPARTEAFVVKRTRDGAD
jgi:hypothetical protein